MTFICVILQKLKNFVTWCCAFQVQSTLNGDCHHCHQFKANHFHPHSSSKLILALCLCILFMAAEMVGGYIAGSVAVVSDGAHLLTDVVGFLISLIAIATSKKKNTKNFNLGFYRIGTIFLCYLISVLAAFFYLKILFFNYRYKAFTFNFSIRVSFEYLACINSNLKSKAQDVTPVTAVGTVDTKNLFFIRGNNTF